MALKRGIRKRLVLRKRTSFRPLKPILLIWIKWRISITTAPVFMKEKHAPRIWKTVHVLLQGIFVINSATVIKTAKIDFQAVNAKVPATRNNAYATALSENAILIYAEIVVNFRLI